MGAISEYDKTMLVAKMRAGKERKRTTEKGWSEGRKPFGVRNTNERDDKARDREAKTLAHIRELRVQGLNYEQLARALNAEGSKTRSGGQWYPATVRRILLSNAA